MKRRRLELADAAFHASHGSKLLTSCPLCDGIARRSFHGRSKETDIRISGGERDASATPVKLPPLNTKNSSGSKIQSNSSQTALREKGLKTRGSAAPSVKEDDLSSSEMAYLSSVVNAGSTIDSSSSNIVKGQKQKGNLDIATQILRQCLMEISSIDWETNVDGLMKMTDILRFSPHLVSESGCLLSVLRSLTVLAGSQRSKLCIAACRTACTIFKRMLCTQRPEFNHLVSALLVRSCDNNRFVRQEADRALDAMAAYIPAFNSILALLDQDGRQSNAEVRSATARTLDLVVEYQGAEALLASRETRDKLWPALASFVDDANPATRDYANHTCETLTQDPRFTQHWQHRLDRCPPSLRKRLYRYAAQRQM